MQLYLCEKPPQARDIARILKAAAVLEKMGLTVSDAVRILLTRIANEGGLPPGLTADPQVYDAWFRKHLMPLGLLFQAMTQKHTLPPKKRHYGRKSSEEQWD